MGEFVFTAAKGAVAERSRRDGTLGVLLLKTAEPDDVLKTYRTVDEMLAGNAEADFTGYERHTGIPGEVVIDDADEHVDVLIPPQTWERAGAPGEQQRIRKLVVFHDEGGVLTPLTGHDADAVTDGNTLRVEFVAGGFYRAV